MTGGLQARLPKINVETNRQVPPKTHIHTFTHAYTHALWHEPRSFENDKVNLRNDFTQGPYKK